MYPFRHLGYITELTCTRFVHFGYMSIPICIQKSNLYTCFFVYVHETSKVCLDKIAFDGQLY